MSSLLIFVFAFFGVHTSLWFARSVRAKKGPGKPAVPKPAPEPDATAEKNDE
jgi:hypothetical protein